MDASHSCNSNPGANVIRPQFAKSEKVAESTLSQPTAVLKPASAQFAGRYTKQKGQTSQKESISRVNMQLGRLWPIPTGCYHSLFLLHLRKFLETVCGKEKNPLPTKSCVPVSSSTAEPQTQEHWSKETI